MKAFPVLPLLLLLSAAAPRLSGQEISLFPDSAAAAQQEFAIGLTLGGGYSHYFMPYDAPIEIDRMGGTVNLRLMLYPDHRLRMGIETGWTHFYSYALEDIETSFGVTDASLSLSAIPLLAVFSMPVTDHLQFHAGTGGYFVRSHTTSFGSTADVTEFSQGWMGAVSWIWGEWGTLRLESELKWYGATQFDDGVLILQMQGGCNILRWQK
ncbi:MAG: hypothetical protein JXA28_07400 [Bacteroidetes bacterium]|nr:hypothetical protein [Bacteroidota bacterium]